MRLLIEFGLLAACLGFGVFAILHLKQQGEPVLDGLGLRFDRKMLPLLLTGLVIAGVTMNGVAVLQATAGGVQLVTGEGQQAALRQIPVRLALDVKEELLMRALLLSGLLIACRGRNTAAILLSAIAYGLIHLSNPGATWVSVLGNSLGGLMYGVAFVLTGSIWLPLGLHFGWNFVQGSIWGLPVSGLSHPGFLRAFEHGPAHLTGGAYGPEASVLGIAARFVILLIVWLTVANVESFRAAPRTARPRRTQHGS